MTIRYQSDLAEVVGCTTTHLNLILKGKSRPSDKLAAKLETATTDPRTGEGISVDLWQASATRGKMLNNALTKFFEAQKAIRKTGLRNILK